MSVAIKSGLVDGTFLPSTERRCNPRCGQVAETGFLGVPRFGSLPISWRPAASTKAVALRRSAPSQASVSGRIATS